jgi:3-oxoacyl-[acyl-carrier protein] reductase
VSPSEAPAYLVLGASGGIGAAVARGLSGAGARVLLAARTRERLEPLARALDAPWVLLDATRGDQVEAAAAQALETWGRLDGLACCVGSLLLKPAHLTSDDEWDATIAQNLRTAFVAVRTAGKLMQGSGSVVLFSSAAASLGLARHEAIAAAKAGVVGLARAAAATYAPRGLRFNVVAPGLVETPLTARITASPASREASLAMHPLGRLGRAEDVASAACWLLDPRQSWVTGQVLGVDGGLATVRSVGRGA